MICNADLHIHSLFSMASSKSTNPENLINSCLVKGLHILGSGDALHPVWRKMWIDYGPDGRDVTVVPTAEVQAEGRVHHLILMKDFDQAGSIAEELRPFSKNMDADGRPHVKLDGGRIAKIVHDVGAFIGPAHAFTPWTGMYGRFDSLHECYGDEPIDFLELGLSADTSYGERIPELSEVPFLSNSDAHSPQLHKLGREFNRLDIDNRSVKSVLDAVTGGKIVLNAGFFPEEGKYNRTACTRCYRQFSVSEAESFSWKCPDDGGRIKMGVRDRALSHSENLPGEGSRPPYYHMVPLGEIIQKTVGASSPCTKKCTELYWSFINTLGDEISILIDIPYEKLASVDEKTAEAIMKFRKGDILLHPGGGGRYGSFDLK